MTTTPNRRPLVELRHGQPCLVGTRLPVRSVQDYVDAGYGMAHIRSEFPIIEDWTDAELAAVATYPVIAQRLVDDARGFIVIIHDDGDIHMDGYVSTANIPALIALLQEAQALVEAWRAACDVWMEEHNG